MRFLVVMLLLIPVTCEALELIIGGRSTHIFTKTYKSGSSRKKFNSNHNIIGIGYYFNDHYLSAMKFDNSYHRKSYAVSYGHKYKSLYIGATAATGYDEVNASNVGRLAVAPSIKYNFNPFSFMLMSDAAVISIAIDL